VRAAAARARAGSSGDASLFMRNKPFKCAWNRIFSLSERISEAELRSLFVLAAESAAKFSSASDGKESGGFPRLKSSAPRAIRHSSSCSSRPPASARVHQSSRSDPKISKPEMIIASSPRLLRPMLTSLTKRATSALCTS